MRIIVLISLTAIAACGQTTTAPGSGAAPPVSSAPWHTNIPAFLPAIDACLAASPDTRYVIDAAISGDIYFLRLNGAQGPVDCRVTNGQAELSAAAEAEPPEQIEAIFVRGPGENPGGECYEAPEVRDTNGELIGWMLDPEGC